MSKIGKKPVVIPAGVEVQLNGNHIQVKGSKGTLERDIPAAVTCNNDLLIITLYSGLVPLTWVLTLCFLLRYFLCFSSNLFFKYAIVMNK